MHDKKNLLKLLPAAAVIAAVAVTAVQGKATDGIHERAGKYGSTGCRRTVRIVEIQHILMRILQLTASTKEIAKAKKTKSKKERHQKRYCEGIAG